MFRTLQKYCTQVTGKSVCNEFIFTLHESKKVFKWESVAETTGESNEEELVSDLRLMSPPSRCTPDTPQTPAPLSRPHAPVSLCRPVRGRPPQLRLARPHFSRNPGKRYQEFRAGQRRWDGGKIEKRSLFHPSRCQGTREKRRPHPFPWGISRNCWEWGKIVVCVYDFWDLLFNEMKDVF